MTRSRPAGADGLRGGRRDRPWLVRLRPTRTVVSGIGLRGGRVTMVTPRSMTEQAVKEHLAAKLGTIDQRVRAVCEDPDVTDRLSEPVVPLARLREVVERHNGSARTAWSPDEAAQLVRFLGDLVHDVELVREMLAFPTHICFPRVLREERLGE